MLHELCFCDDLNLVVPSELNDSGMLYARHIAKVKRVYEKTDMNSDLYYFVFNNSQNESVINYPYYLVKSNNIVMIL